MLEWLKSMVKPSAPAGPSRVLRAFSVADETIDRDAVAVEEATFKVHAYGDRSIALFEIGDPDVENGMLTYSAQVRSQGVTGRAYLEMWCRFPGRGDFFSKGFQGALKGDNDWSSKETPFYLKTGQKPDLIKLNIAIEGGGDVWLKDIELRFASYE